MPSVPTLSSVPAPEPSGPSLVPAICSYTRHKGFRKDSDDIFLTRPSRNPGKPPGPTDRKWGRAISPRVPGPGSGGCAREPVTQIPVSLPPGPRPRDPWLYLRDRGDRQVALLRFLQGVSGGPFSRTTPHPRRTHAPRAIWFQRSDVLVETLVTSVRGDSRPKNWAGWFWRGHRNQGWY